ncbi:MAG: glycerol-3-phosphate dehydrogenase/oxidase [Verrucomicrobiales bacterium]|jgi:glycerol-3-phosphate dehydrogenase|nr:glycerol-3-phosphate dehydrogenase/oxidase [Verrucomicrobiales bacterium]
MNRAKLLESLRSRNKPWDVVVVGGGATGLGVALDATSRGLKTVLLEQNDFAKATSSRSTKIAHGGVRYLQQGDIPLVYEALHERGLMIQNAPHLVHPLTYVVPTFKWWELPFYGIGLKVYDALSGFTSLGRSKILSRAKALEHLPTIRKEINGGVLYMDGQFDDARLALTLALTMNDQGGVPLNYMKVTSLVKADGRVSGVVANDEETGEKFTISARVVVNATGIFTDSIRHMDEPDAHHLLSVSQGVHIVVDKSYLPGTTAFMIPKTEDGRVLFGIPWHDRLVIGTTDIPRDEAELEPKPLEEEIEFLVHHSNKYLTKPLARKDVLAVFAGLRPLVAAGDGKQTKKLSRNHRIIVSDAGLVTIAGGKWTTYRRMAEQTVDRVVKVGDLEAKPCPTKHMPLHGYLDVSVTKDIPETVYGTDWLQIKQIADANGELAQKIHPNLPYTLAEVVWAVREEQARTLDDVLARRTRSLLLDTRASIEIAPKIAALIAKELNKDDSWVKQQTEEFVELAKRYLP